MSGTDVIDGAIVAALACAAGAGELIAHKPEFAALVLTTKPGRRYMAINIVAGLVAYAIALALQVHFRAPNDLWRVLICGLTSMAVLRSAIPGIEFPVQALNGLREQYEGQLAGHHQIRAARRADKMARGLNWETDREPLGQICLVIAERHTSKERDRMARRIAEIDKSDLKPELSMYSLASWLQSEFGPDVLEEATRKLREIGTQNSSAVPA